MILLPLLAAAALGASPVTFADAVREALDHGAAAEIADAERRQARAEASSGASFANPAVEVERLPDETELRMSVPVPISGAPLAARREATALRDAAAVRGAAAIATAGLEAGRAYLDAQRADDLSQLAADTLALAERRRAAAKRQLVAEEIGSVDAAAIDGEAATAIAAASIAESEAFRTRLLLEAGLGRPISGDVAVSGWPALGQPEEIDPATLPDVIEASDRARAAVASRTRARLELVPTPAITGGYRASPDGAGLIVGVAVGVPLFSPGIARARAAAAASDRAAASSRLAELDASARWLAGVHEAESARIAWEAMDAGALRGALVGLGQALDAGELSIAEYGARRDAIVTGLETTIDAHHRLEIARLELWELAGILPPEVAR